MCKTNAQGGRTTLSRNKNSNKNDNRKKLEHEKKGDPEHKWEKRKQP